VNSIIIIIVLPTYQLWWTMSSKYKERRDHLLRHIGRRNKRKLSEVIKVVHMDKCEVKKLLDELITEGTVKKEFKADRVMLYSRGTMETMKKMDRDICKTLEEYKENDGWMGKTALKNSIKGYSTTELWHRIDSLSHADKIQIRGEGRRHSPYECKLLNFDLPIMVDRRKITTEEVKPKNNPPYEDFYHCLYNKHPEMFKVDISTVKNAGLGLFFRGRCKKEKDIIGYGGEVKEWKKWATKASNYSIQIGNQKKYILDPYNERKQFRNDPQDFNNVRRPFGYMVNSPPIGKFGQLESHYHKESGLMFLRTRVDINTKNKWKELFMPYNNKH